MKYMLMLCTAGNAPQAEKIADHLVRNRLAACVNVVPSVKSFFIWKDKLEIDREALLLIKTEEGRIPEIEKAIREIHPYENPELIALPIEYGKAEYLEWISDSLRI